LIYTLLGILVLSLLLLEFSTQTPSLHSSPSSLPLQILLNSPLACYQQHALHAHFSHSLQLDNMHHTHTHTHTLFAFSSTRRYIPYLLYSSYFTSYVFSSLDISFICMLSILHTPLPLSSFFSTPSRRFYFAFTSLPQHPFILSSIFLLLTWINNKSLVVNASSLHKYSF
jgi:hypothetical protein